MAVTLSGVQYRSLTQTSSDGKEEEEAVTATATDMIQKSGRQLYHALKDIRSGRQTALNSETIRFLSAFDKVNYISCLGESEVEVYCEQGVSVAVTSGFQPTHQIQYNISKFEVEGHEALVYSLFEGLLGEAYGAVFAQVNIPSLLQKLLERSPSLNDAAIISVLKEHMNILNNELLKSQSKILKQYMTTALVALYIKDKIYIANIGDSKAYLFKSRRPSNHSYASQTMSLHSLTEQALVHKPRFSKNVFNNLDVARALGSCEAKPKITCIVKGGESTIDEENKRATLAFESGDLLILATKGFASEVDQKLVEIGMVRMLKKMVDLEGRAAYLARGAYALGSKDPIGTVVATL